MEAKYINGWHCTVQENDHFAIEHFKNYPLSKDFEQWHGNLWPMLRDNFLAERGGVALDLGSNYGFFTIPFASHFDKVYAFDMQLDVLTCLYANISALDISNVTLVHKAVSDKDEVLSYMPRNPSGHCYLLPDDSGRIKVESVKLDSYPIEGDVRFIKLDIEGAELKALHGGIELIQKHRPLIMLEFHSQRDSLPNFNARQDLLQFFKEIEYELVDFVRNDYIFAPK